MRTRRLWAMLLAIVLFVTSFMPLFGTRLTVSAATIPTDGKYEGELNTSAMDSFVTGGGTPFANQNGGSGVFSVFAAMAIGDYAVYKIDVAEEGDYKLNIRYRRHETTGNSDFYVNGVKHTKNFDNRVGTSYNTFYDYDMGTVHLVQGTNTLKFIITAKGSTGFRLNIDYFQLTKEGTVTIPDMEFGSPITQGNITVYPMPFIYSESDTYGVKVNGLKVPVVKCNSDYDYANFSMSPADTTIEITTPSNISSYTITPQKLGIQGTVSGNKLTFTIPKDEYLIVTIPGLKRLVISADPKETDVPASTGVGIFNVLEEPYKADRTSTILAQSAIQKAIDDASAYGSINGNSNGTVYIPVGVYKIGNLVLKSNVDIYLEGGAVLYASTNRNDFEIKAHKDSLNKDVTFMLYTQNKAADGTPMESTDMKVYGRGTIDANGSKVEQSANLLVQTIIPANCSYFTCDGITVKESNIWSVSPAWSDHLTFTNMKFMNQLNGSHENDCIDINGCQEVLVKNCIGIALDDPFSTKTWAVNVDLGKSWNGPAENVENVVFDDLVSWTWCYGFKVGQGSFNDQKNVTFKNGTVYDCAVGLGVHHKYGTGTFDNITFDNIDIERVTCKNDDNRSWFMLQVMGGSNGVGPIYNVNVKNVTVRDKGITSSKILGLSADAMAKVVNFENIKLLGNTKPATTLAQMNVTNRDFYEDAYVLDGTPSEIQAVYYNNASGITIENESPITDTTGGTTHIKGSNGAYAEYSEVNFGTGVSKIAVRLASTNATDSKIDLYLDNMSNYIGSIDATGNSADYVTRTADVSTISGVHTLYLKFNRQSDTNNVANVNWIDVYYNSAKINQTGNVGFHNDIHFGETGTDNLVLKASTVGTGTVEVRLDDATGAVLGTTTIKDTNGKMVERSIALNGAIGRHNLYFVTTGNITLDSFDYIKDNKTNQQHIPSGVTLNQSNATIQLEKQLLLSANITPIESIYKDIFWEVISGDTSVTVSNIGEVTALSNGTAVVRATSVTNPEAYAECNITVTDTALNIIEIPSITIETQAGTLPVMPEKVNVKNSAGTLQLATVTAWDYIDTSKYNQVGTFHVFGTVEGTGLKVDAIVIVKYAALPEVPPVTVKLETPPSTPYENSGKTPAFGSSYIYYGDAIGDWIKIPVSVATSGIYNVKVTLKRHSSKGIFALYANDTYMKEYDQYYNGNQENVVVDMGNVNLENSGVQNFKFEIVGKNPSSGGFQMVISSITLTPAFTGMIPTESDISIQAGLSHQLTYKFSNIYDNAQSVVYSVISGNEFASVNQYGMVKGLKVGYAIVRVASNRYEGMYIDYPIQILPGVTINNPILDQTSVTFDKNAENQADVSTNITWNDATMITDIRMIGSSLGSEAYVVSGGAITIKKEFLVTLVNGITELSVEFDKGDAIPLYITIIDSSVPAGGDAEISPALRTFDKKVENQSDVNTVILWNGATTITDIKVSGVSIDTTSFAVSGNSLIIKKEFLASKAIGIVNLSIEFDYGNMATFIINIVDTTPSPTPTPPIPTPTTPIPIEEPVTEPQIVGEDDVTGWNAIKNVINNITSGNTSGNSGVKTLVIDMNRDSVLPKDIITTLKGKPITLQLRMSDYSWFIEGKDITGEKLSDIDLSITKKVNMIPESTINSTAGDRKIMELQLAHNGEFGFLAILSLNVDEGNNGSIANLYYYDPVKKDLMLQSVNRVDEYGNVNFTFTHASDYVIVYDDKAMLDKEISNIKVKASEKILYVGGTIGKTASIKVTLPEIIKNAITNGIVVESIKFESSNKKVATISKDGKILARSNGTTTITTKITIDGKELKFTDKITVKKASITVQSQKTSFKVGEVYTYKISLNGFTKSDVTFTTTEKSIVAISEKSGKAVAKSKGTDYVVIKCRNISKKIKVTVN
ncbi:MAG: coagulation factor 5/8 type domain protein [Anaerocolumna sp.]|jgi:polygalacturonase|nr:coagulation factor 5/8 type domain protein [Anaerocolumna sp.]